MVGPGRPEEGRHIGVATRCVPHCVTGRQRPAGAAGERAPAKDLAHGRCEDPAVVQRQSPGRDGVLVVAKVAQPILLESAINAKYDCFHKFQTDTCAHTT
jgi:hypothetical protein